MSVLEVDGEEAGFAEIIADTARAVFDDVGTIASEKARAASEKGEWLTDAWEQLSEAGFIQAMRSEVDGGVGIKAAMQIIRLSGSAALSLPLAEAMAADWLLAQVGLPPAAAPTVFLPDLVTLMPAGDRIDVRANITNVPWARNCDLACIGMLDGLAQLFLLNASQFSIERSENLAGEPRDTVTVDISLPRSDFTRLAGADEATPHHMGALLRSVQLAGAAQGVVQMTTGYASERSQFGRTLSAFQAVQQLLAIIAGEVAAAGVAADMAAQSWTMGFPLAAVATTKIRTGEAAGKIAATAHQIHGAIGFTREHALQLLTRRLWSWRDEFGGEAAWSLQLGQQLARGNCPLWYAITDFSK